MDDFKKSSLAVMGEYSWKDAYEGISSKDKPKARRIGRRRLKRLDASQQAEAEKEDDMGENKA